MPDFMNTMGGALGFGAATSALNLGFGLVGNAVTGLIDNAFYKRNLNLQVEAQKGLIDYQNEYNSPSSQMQRLLAAGLNPNLVYGSAAPAGISGNSQAPSGSGFAGKYTTSDVASAALNFMKMKEADSVINSNNAVAAKNTAEAGYYNKLSGRYDELVNSQISEANARISELSTREAVNASEVTKNNALAVQAEADAAYKNGLISKLEYEKQNLIAQTILLGAEARKAKAEAYKAWKEGHYYAANASYLNQKAKTEEELTGYYAQLGEREYYEASISRIQYRWNEIVYSEPNAQKQREAMEKTLEKEANEMGIKGKKAVIWISTVMSWLTGAGSTAASGVQAGAAMKIANTGAGGAAVAVPVAP